MNKFAFLIIALYLPACLASDDNDKLETVGEINLEQYVGTWNEIASIPATFARKCVANTTAEYRQTEDGLIEVINSCENKDGGREVAEGRARINDKYNLTSILEVTFVKLGKWVWSLSGDYWVIGLGKNYEYSVVGEPKRKYGWILSREKKMDLATLLSIRDQLALQKYDTCKFLMTRTTEQNYPAGTKLCDLSEGNE